jgi:hypothetical protein
VSRERIWTCPSIEGEPDVTAPLRAIVKDPGCQVKPIRLMSGAPALSFTGVGAGRGRRKPTFLMAGRQDQDHADLFAVLAACLRDWS